MDVIRNNGKTQRIHFRFTLAPITLSLHTWGSCSHGSSEGRSSFAPTPTKAQMSVLGQALASLGLSWASFHFTRGRLQESPEAPHPPGEGSRPCPRTAAVPTALRTPSSACPRAALILLGLFFGSLFHVRKGAFVRGHALPPQPRPFRYRSWRGVTFAAPHAVIGSRRAEAAPPSCAGGLAGKAGGA